ncbi:unnamed protein product [Didymodactylos carnosus]|uniref:Uncharacterized protein n=1 Tax=Didymodactylos carnosus TaxID=1234261 RepID=A0A8S2Q8E4_9BILA|nr:unnamed protein product [Didymodactylos carnosus]CAF4086506.1 unnamed protein product [Didymodactylos carnosus]
MTKVLERNVGLQFIFSSAEQRNSTNGISTVTENQYKTAKEHFLEKFGAVIENMRKESSSSRLHTDSEVQAAGLSYVGDTGCVKCTQCNIEIPELTKEMNLFNEHTLRSPQCPTVKKILVRSEQEETISSIFFILCAIADKR